MTIADTVMRLKGWEKRFIHEITAVMDAPFDWRSSNCGHVIVAAVRACHGDHPIADFLQPCIDEASTLELLGREGGMQNIIERFFHRLPTPMLAQQADIGIVRGKYYDVHSGEYIENDVGVAFVDGVALGKREKGVFRIPHSRVQVAFKV